jgi:hypothetical protein
MNRRSILGGVTVLGLFGASVGALAEDTFKIGLLQSMTGTLAPVGKQVIAGLRIDIGEDSGPLQHLGPARRTSLQRHAPA